MTELPPPQVKKDSRPTGWWIGLIVAAGLGGFALAYLIFGRPAEVAPTPTQVALAPTRAISIPTTPVPTLTETSPPPITQTRRSPTVTATPARDFTLTINLPANVRSGPGTNYPVIASLEAGEAPTVIGRDTAANWFVIEIDAADGQGWVSGQVGSLSGDPNDLPVVPAPPTPSATGAPAAGPTTKPPASSRGIVGQLTLCNPRTTYAISERVCFVERIVNTTGGTIAYGLLGVQAANLSGGPSQFQTSWSGELFINAGCTGPTDTCGGPWEDGIRINTAGSYRLTMQICYATVDACQGSSADWETLAKAIFITVQ
ncbi:MAG: SH3 domain-containing protein [Anaerolineales bacterium]